jgi:hypothetical protein
MTDEPLKNDDTPASAPTYADLLKEGGEFDTRLRETRGTARDGSRRLLHEELGQILRSLQLNPTTSSFDPPVNAVLRFRLFTRAKKEMPDTRSVGAPDCASGSRMNCQPSVVR